MRRLTASGAGINLRVSAHASFHIEIVLRLLRMAVRGDKRLFNADSFCRF